MDKVVTLRCPLCQSLLLSYRRAEIWDRDAKDFNKLEKGWHVTLNKNANVDIDRSMADNPSARQNGVRLEFNCAACHGKPHLDIWESDDETKVEFS